MSSIDKEYEEFTDYEVKTLIDFVEVGIKAAEELLEKYREIKTFDDIQEIAVELGRDNDMEMRLIRYAPEELVKVVVEKFMGAKLDEQAHQISTLKATLIKLHLLKSRI